MTLAARLSEARLALMLLTRLPVGQFAGEPPSIAAARWAFPFVGLVIGALGWAGFAGAQALGLPVPVAAGLALAVQLGTTGALHLDGLADYADGMGARDRTRALEIMRDSRIGSYGVIALIVVLGLIWSAMSTTAIGDAPWVFLLAGAGSRMAMLWVLIALPPARADGMGRMATGQGARALWPGMALMPILLWPFGISGLIAALIAGALCLGLAAQARRRLGGQTGDVLGAVQVLCEAALWIALAARPI